MNYEETAKRNSFWKGFLAGALSVGAFLTLVFVICISTVGSIKVLSVKNNTSGSSSGNKANGQTSDPLITGRVVDSKTAKKIDEIYSIIDREFLFQENIDMDKMHDSIYRAVLSSLDDKYTEYYSPEELENLLSDSSGVYYGVGSYVTMDTEKNLPYFSGVFEGSPAMTAGIRDGDYIYKVNGEEVMGLTLDEVVTKVKGPKGSTVDITILRGDETLEITVTRDEVESPTVTYEMKEDKVGYIQIQQFDTVTSGQFEEAYKALNEQGMKSLVIDLRSNPGGNLDTVLNICGQILPKGVITYTIDVNGNREDYNNNKDNRIQIPLAVLVNEYSASASELMTGAIKDYGVGTIIGTTTFGKGIVQSIRMLSDGSGMKFTTNRYYTPNGVCIHGEGITPDKIVEFDSESYYAEESFDNQLDYAIKYLTGQTN